MNSMAYSDFLCILVTVGVFVYLFYGPWQAFVVDSTRQRLFEIRDSLFDEAAARGRLNAESYRVAREIINAQIRYAHEIDFPHILLTTMGALFNARPSIAAASGLVDRIVAKETDESFKAVITAALHNSFKRSMVTLFLRSLSSVIVFPVILILAIVAAGVAIIPGTAKIITKRGLFAAPRRRFQRSMPTKAPAIPSRLPGETATPVAAGTFNVAGLVLRIFGSSLQSQTYFDAVERLGILKTARA